MLEEAGPELTKLKNTLSVAPLLIDAQSQEYGNPAWAAASLRILILRLSPFEDVSRSSPHLFLFQTCREALKDAYLDFAFFPPAEDRALLSAAQLPLGYGLASGRGMADYDIVLISNAYVLELVNLPYILLHSGIAIDALKDEKERSPLIILGGSSAGAASAILSDCQDGKAPAFVDALFFGEGEDELGPILSALVAISRSGPGFSGAEKARALQAAGEASEGLFYPGKTTKTSQCHAPSGVRRPASRQPYPLLNSEEAGSYKLEMSSGCPSFCGFCMESWDRKPYRETQTEELLDEALWAKRYLGSSSLELSSFNFNTHADMVSLMLKLGPLFPRVSAMSQRADILQNLPGLLAFEKAMGKRSFTIGIEGISERMRLYYAKELGEAEILPLLRRLLEISAREIKLFYIISGLESQEDLEEFAAFVKEIKLMRSASSSATRIIFSAGYLTRMPGTPLAFAPLCLEESCLRRIGGPMKSSCDTNGFEFRLPAYFDEYALSQVLALGAPGIFDALCELAQSGLVFDKNLDRGAWEKVRAILQAKGGLSPEFLGEKTLEHPQAFDFLERATTTDFRYNAYVKAKQALSAPKRKLGRDAEASSCLAASCLGCGACDKSASEREFLQSHSLRAPSLDERAKAEALLKRKAAAPFLHLYVDLPLAMRGAEAAYISSYYQRLILSHCPDQLDNVLHCQEILLSTKRGREFSPNFYGKSILRIQAYDIQSLAAALKGCPSFEPVRAELPADPCIAEAEVRIEAPAGAGASMKVLETALSAYLKAELVAHTLEKKGGRSVWRIAPAGLKKRIIALAESGSDNEGIGLKILARFNFHRYLGHYRDALHQATSAGEMPQLRMISLTRLVNFE